MKIVMLPGLDGTGLLFSKFRQALEDSFCTQIIHYPIDELLSYEELSRLVLKQLPSEKFVLLAESFSGPIAYLVAKAKPTNLTSLVFVASFLSPPRPNILKLFQWLPTSLLLSLPIPNYFIRHFLLGACIEDSSIQQFKCILKQASATTLAFRLRQISQLNLELQPIQYPVIYLQANQDLLVPNNAINPFVKYSKHLKILNIDGPHFILQAHPKRCAKMLADEIY